MINSRKKIIWILEGISGIRSPGMIRDNKKNSFLPETLMVKGLISRHGEETGGMNSGEICLPGNIPGEKSSRSRKGSDNCPDRTYRDLEEPVEYVNQDDREIFSGPGVPARPGNRNYQGVTSSVLFFWRDPGAECQRGISTSQSGYTNRRPCNHDACCSPQNHSGKPGCFRRQGRPAPPLQ